MVVEWQEGKLKMVTIVVTITKHNNNIIMYLHKIPRVPKEVTRDYFLRKIFELGRLYEYGYDTIVAAVELTDRFMLITEPRRSYQRYKKSDKSKKSKLSSYGPKKTSVSEQDEIMKAPIAQIYSKELVVVALTLAGKVNEDEPYGLKYGLEFCANHYIVKMEWELIYCFQYHIRIDNFITRIGLAFNNYPKLGPLFGELAKDVCRIPNWWTLSPLSIIMGTMWLYQQNKLRAVTTNKKNIFRKFISSIAEECEQPVIEILQTYINNHEQ